MLGQRLLTGVLLLAALVAALWWLPRAGWGGLLTACAIAAALEWARLSGLAPAARGFYAAAVGVVCVALLAWAPVDNGWWRMAPLVLNVGFWLLVALPVLAKPGVALSTAQVASCGVIVIVSTYWAFVLLQIPAGGFLALLAVVWVADTAAYFGGKRWGRRKLAPRVSPGKTWEGVAAAVVAVTVYAFAMQSYVRGAWPSLTGAWWIALAYAMTGFGIVGDLFESWLKRRAGVKDSGTLLPGHGGVLDRIDALTAAVPLAALVVAWPA